MTSTGAKNDIEHLLRELAPQVLGVLTKKHADFGIAEDAVQEALIAAVGQWPVVGVPHNPKGWLYRVALRRMTDYMRSDLSRQRRENAVAMEIWADWAFVPPNDVELEIDGDDTLALLFMCCHPSLTSSSAIALTLRAIGGLTTAEIAAAFLVPEKTMAQRISRAKMSIKASGIPFVVPHEEERAERLGTVLHVLYLIFSEGYLSSVGSALQRIDLSNEAMRLARLVRSLLPGSAEVAGLLALMLLSDARRSARTGPSGELIPLDEQDRSLWDQRLISEGVALVSEALTRSPAGYYQLQAAIAAIHDEAAHVEDTDWPQILALYDVLDRMSDNPIVSLNRAIAAAMVHGPSTGLELLTKLDSDTRITGHYRLDAVRAHFHEMAGNRELAIQSYSVAAERTTSIPEQNYLRKKAALLRANDNPK